MVIAGTGHRPNKLGGYGDDVYRQLVTLARSALIEYKPTLVISGGALGWDTALASAAHMEKIPFNIAVPFHGQDKMWPPASKARYAKMISLANEVIVVSEGDFSARKMQIRNEWMVNHCDTLLALWDGSNGGTANCIKYAQSIGHPIINLWGEWK